MENTNISVQTVPYRFSKAMCEHYAAHIRSGLASGKKVMVFAGPEEREKLNMTLPASLTKEEMVQVVVFPYPCNPRVANNVGRGMTNVCAIFIGGVSNYTDLIKPTLLGLTDVSVMFVNAEPMA